MTTATEVKEHPILFTGEMVRAILDGRKTQTRRVIKPQPIKQHHIAWMNDGMSGCGFHVLTNHAATVGHVTCPYGQPGDRLWVRETWCAHGTATGGVPIGTPQDRMPEKTITGGVKIKQKSGNIWEPSPEYPCYVYYKATYGEKPHAHSRWKPNIHMPRWACRLLLEVTDVRVQRVQDISEKDATAEGLERYGVMSFDEDLSPERYGWKNYFGKGYFPEARLSFMTLWDSINAKRGHPWKSNPWVWAVTFRCV